MRAGMPMFSRLLCWLFGHEKRWVVTRTIVGWSCERCGDVVAYRYTILSPPPLEPMYRTFPEPSTRLITAGATGFSNNLSAGTIGTNTMWWGRKEEK